MNRETPRWVEWLLTPLYVALVMLPVFTVWIGANVIRSVHRRWRTPTPEKEPSDG